MEPKDIYNQLLHLEISVQRARASTIKELSDRYRGLIEEVTRHHIAQVEAVELRYSKLLRQLRPLRHQLRPRHSHRPPATDAPGDHAQDERAQIPADFEA